MEGPARAVVSSAPAPFMDAQIVEDNDLAMLVGGDQDVLDGGRENVAADGKKSS